MSSFKNVSGEDRVVAIDGILIPVTDGDIFDVADEHDESLIYQPHFVKGKKKLAAGAAITETPIVLTGENGPEIVVPLATNEGDI